MEIDLTVSSAMHWVEGILMIQVIVSALELGMARPILKDRGLMSWRINRLTHPTLTTYLKRTGCDYLLRYPHVLTLLALRIILAGSIILLLLSNKTVIGPLCLLLVTNLLLLIRGSHANDGSDQMAMIVLLTVTIGEGVSGNYSKIIALGFITFQVVLSYGTSGLLKQRKKGWHNGDFVKDILRTSSFGNATLLVFAERYPLIPTFLGILVVYGDCSIALAALMPPAICCWILCFGVLMHIGIGVILGLNTFLWSFGATYPAVLWSAAFVYHGLSITSIATLPPH